MSWTKIIANALGLGNKIYDDVQENKEARAPKKTEDAIREGRGGDARASFLQRYRLRRARKKISEKRKT